MRLDLVVGPNGAGKSTLVAAKVSPHTPMSMFVNADEIAGKRWPEDPAGHSYDAAAVAEQTRNHLISRREPFIAETVFSHPSKLELIDTAHAAGYFVAVHVLLVPEILAVARVRMRVNAGGHSVPEHKIRERYQRLWPLVVRAIDAADTATVYDNTDIDGPREVARFAGGFPVGTPRWPRWTPAPLSGRWAN